MKKSLISEADIKSVDKICIIQYVKNPKKQQPPKKPTKTNKRVNKIVGQKVDKYIKMTVFL